MSGGIGLTRATVANSFPALVCPLNDPRAFVAVGGISANQAVGTRVIVPLSGTLVDLNIFVTTSSGNIDVGIYDTTVTTRTKLYSTGSIACPTANQWTEVGDPNITVSAGDQLDFVWAADNTSAQVAKTTTPHASIPGLPTGFNAVLGGGVPKLAWWRNSTFPLPSTIAESGLNVNHTSYAIICRVA